jgi:hypothetical protein
MQRELLKDGCRVYLIKAASVYTVKKRLATFPSPAGISLAKPSRDVTYHTLPALIKLFPPRDSLVSAIPAEDGNVANFFLQCTHSKEEASRRRVRALRRSAY